MPIKLKCSCGQSLTVPDSLAGKTGKCPKCQAAIRIPAATAAAPATTSSGAAAAKPAAAKPAAAKQPAAPAKAAVAKTAAAPAAPAPAIVSDDVFDEIGLKKKTGPTCPKCATPIVRNAAICTSCGLNFQTGEQLAGFNAQAEVEEFKNAFLKEAATNMSRDNLAEERHAKAGLPWWMLVSVLLGALCIGAAGVVLVDATFNEPAPVDTFLGKVQRQKFGVIAGVTFTMVGTLIALFADLSIVVFAFGKSTGKGIASLLVPPYSFIYGCGTWADNKTGIYGLIMGGLLIGGGLWLTNYSGNIDWNPPAGTFKPPV